MVRRFLIGDSGIFTSIINQLANDGSCSGDFADEKFPRFDWLTQGQEAAKDGLSKLVSWLTTFRASCSASKPNTPPDLLGFLKSRACTVAKDLRPELKRRGVTPGGSSKAVLADAIFAHVQCHLDGYPLAVEVNDGIADGKAKGALMGWAPCGFVGEKPPPATAAAAAAAGGV